MIAAWMVYTIAVTLLLLAGGRAAEHLARAMRVPARFVWATAMLLALVLSTRAFGRRTENRVDASRPAEPRSSIVWSATAAGSNTPAAESRYREPPSSGIERILTIADRVRDRLSATAGAASRAAGRIDVASLEHWNAPLIALWLVVSGAAVLWLGASLIRLRGIERGLARERIAGHAVLVSRDLGPALLGIVRARIVVPRWVLRLPPEERDIILAHEREHAAAFDPAMLGAAVIAIVLQPWNLPLWLLFAGLRLAIEADCDRRVLAATGDARRYGRLLIDVYERTRPGLAPRTAFVERPSNLERRIRRLTRRPRLLSTAAWTVSVPARQSVHQAPAVRAGKPALVWRAPKRPSVVTLPAVVTRGMRTEHSAIPDRPAAAEARRTLEPCGIGARVGELCQADGRILIWLADSMRVVVAFHDSSSLSASSSPTLRVFLFTMIGTTHAVTSRTIESGHAEFQHGALYVVDRAAGEPGLIFGTSQALTDRNPSAVSFRSLMGSATFLSSTMTFDLIRQLRPVGPCDLHNGFTTPGSPDRLDNPRPGEVVASSTPRPLIVVDGVVVSEGGFDGCFEAGGSRILFP